MVKEAKQKVYEIWTGDDHYTISAKNRFEAVVKAIPRGVNEKEILYVRLEGTRTKFYYPWRSKKATSLVVNQTSMNFTADPVPTSGTMSGTDMWSEANKVRDEYECKVQSMQAELDALREKLSVGGSDELKKAMEFGQAMFNGDVQDLIASNEHLRDENAKLKDKLKEGVSITMLPGGHAIIIYGGRVLELSDLPAAPGA